MRTKRNNPQNQRRRGQFISNLDDPYKVKLIKKMAIVYITTRGSTYTTIAARFKVDRSTVIRYFNRDLPKISSMLYAAVKRKAGLNIESARERGLATIAVSRQLAKLQRELYDEDKNKS